MMMKLIDVNGNSIDFAYVESIRAARNLWVQIAGVTAECQLAEFVVVSEEYRGSYVTDEC